jgi:hypothetical protein
VPGAIFDRLLLALLLRAWKFPTNHFSCDNDYARASLSLIDVVVSSGGGRPADVHDNDGRPWWGHCCCRLHSDDLDAAMFYDQDV